MNKKKKDNQFSIPKEINKKESKQTLHEEETNIKREGKIKIQKHINIATIGAVWIIPLFFLFLMSVFIIVISRLLFDKSYQYNEDLFVILSAFLSGALGAGFGDSIFKKIKTAWNAS